MTSLSSKNHKVLDILFYTVPVTDGDYWSGVDKADVWKDPDLSLELHNENNEKFDSYPFDHYNQR